MITKEKFMNLQDDLCFKKVFSNKIILEDFINSFFKYRGIDNTFSFSDVYFEFEVLPNSKEYKVNYNDMVITLNNGDLINLEMYKNTFTKENYNKSFDYMNNLFSKQIKSGAKKYKDAKKVISINLIKGNFRKMNSKLINTYDFRENTSHRLIDDGNTEMHLVRFDLSRKLSYNLFDEKFERWLKLISSETLEEMEEIAKGDEIMEESIEFVKEWNRTHVHTLDDYIAEQKEDAEYRGYERGKEHGILETAKNMISDNLKISTIMKYTGLTKKEIKSLKKEM